jgi:hypothetical protein
VAELSSGPAGRHADGSARATATLATRSRRFEFRYRVDGAAVAAGPEPFLAASLLLAMRAGEPLAVAEPVSPRLLAGVARLQDIFHVWDRRFRRIEIRAAAAGGAAQSAGTRGVACFFSGGVDSFYSVLKHAEALAALVFCVGWDPPAEDPARRRTAAAAVRAAAAALGKPLVTVETNLHAEREGVVSWRLYHGAALASVALLLAPAFRRVLIPASHSYADLLPLGSHPLVDPLWSTEATEIVHDGCEATRVERVARIARSPIALRWLRVCGEARADGLNCGECEKCVRTMVGLRLAGALDRCPTFARPLDLEAVARLDVANPHLRAYARENLRAAEAAGGDLALAAALRASLERAEAAVAGGATG